jgi:hypothetical protein
MKGADGKIYFLLVSDGNSVSNGGVLRLEDDGTITKINNYNITAHFEWAGKFYVITSDGALHTMDSGGNFVNAGVDASSYRRAEGLDGKLYFMPDFPNSIITRINTSGTVETLDLLDYGVRDIVRNVKIISSTDKKIILNIYHGQIGVGDGITYDIYGINGSGVPVHIANKDSRGAVKAQNGKTYLFGYDGAYWLDGWILRDTNISDAVLNESYYLELDGSLYLPHSSVGGGNGFWRLEDGGDFNHVDFLSPLYPDEIFKINGRAYILKDNHGIYYLEGDEIKPTNITSDRKSVV